MMTRSRRFLLPLVAVLSLAPFSACNTRGNVAGLDDEPGDMPTSEQLAIEIDPRFFEFRHVVGQSPCPQLIGRLTIRNRGTSPFTTDLRARDERAPLAFGPDRTVQPGQSVVIEIFFTCTSQTSFLTTVDTFVSAAISNQSTLPGGSFNVSGIIVR